MRAVNISILAITGLIALAIATFVVSLLVFGAFGLLSALAVAFLGGVAFAACAGFAFVHLCDATEYINVEPSVSP